MTQVPMIAEMRQTHNGVGLRVGQQFMADNEAEAADMVAIRAASRDKSVRVPVAPVVTRTMQAVSEQQEPEGKTAEELAEDRAAREQSAREAINRPGQHQRRDMRARK